MSKRSFSVRTLTPTATADAATPLAADTYFGVIQGGDALQRNLISEIMLGGQAGASAPTIIVAGMNSVAATVITVGTVGEDAPLDGATGALSNPADVGLVTTIPPQRSPTLGHVLQLSFNAFGGIVRWLAAPGEEIGIVGLITNTGSWALSAFTGGTPGAMSSHFIYESL